MLFLSMNLRIIFENIIIEFPSGYTIKFKKKKKYKNSVVFNFIIVLFPLQLIQLTIIQTTGEKNACKLFIIKIEMDLPPTVYCQYIFQKQWKNLSFTNIQFINIHIFVSVENITLSTAEINAY